ncbi:MAG TPA: ATP-binding protein [Phycisphaerae bacterium]|nr:ATP-binding protein [Phycisphaerae bacterium]
MIMDTSVPHSSTETEQRLQAQFERLERQFAMLKDQTRQAQKLASLGTAAAMLAHEFNNLMSPVVGYAKYAVDAQDPELMTKALTMTLKQTAIVTAMSDRILGLAVSEAQAVAPVSVHAAVADAEACLCRDLSKDGIRLVNEVDAEVQVLADPRQLQQVLFNLFLNARQAIKHRNGRIKVTAEAGDDNTVNIHVADNGAGIPEEAIQDIFDAFYSTKDDRPDKSGLGLGLTLCRDIVEEHHGRIGVASEVGKGTTFTITLPAA